MDSTGPWDRPPAPSRFADQADAVLAVVEPLARQVEDLREAIGQVCQGADEPYDLHLRYCVPLLERVGTGSADGSR